MLMPVKYASNRCQQCFYFRKNIIYEYTYFVFTLQYIYYEIVTQCDIFYHIERNKPVVYSQSLHLTEKLHTYLSSYTRLCRGVWCGAQMLSSLQQLNICITLNCLD